MSEESVRNSIEKACSYAWCDYRPQYLFIMSVLNDVHADDAVGAAARLCAGMPE